jgi:hypothetical protein
MSMQSTNLTRQSQNQAANHQGWSAYARWILVLVFVLGWSQSALVLPAQRVSLAEALNQAAALKAHPVSEAMLTHSLPATALQPASEAEIMDEDDDESNRSTAVQEQSPACLPSFYEAQYASFIRIRLSQLQRQIQERAEVARFVRFHSWKSDPC